MWGWSMDIPQLVSPGKLLAAAVGSWRFQGCQAVGLGRLRNIQEVSKVPMCWAGRCVRDKHDLSRNTLVLVGLQSSVLARQERNKGWKSDDSSCPLLCCSYFQCPGCPWQ